MRGPGRRNARGRRDAAPIPRPRPRSSTLRMPPASREDRSPRRGDSRHAESRGSGPWPDHPGGRSHPPISRPPDRNIWLSRHLRRDLCRVPRTCLPNTLPRLILASSYPSMTMLRLPLGHGCILLHQSPCLRSGRVAPGDGAQSSHILNFTSSYAIVLCVSKIVLLVNRNYVLHSTSTICGPSMGG